MCGGNGSACKTVLGIYSKGTTKQSGFSEVSDPSKDLSYKYNLHTTTIPIDVRHYITYFFSIFIQAFCFIIAYLVVYLILYKFFYDIRQHDVVLQLHMYV